VREPADPRQLGLGIVKSNHRISEIARLTFARRTPGVVTLHYRRSSSDAGATAATVGRSYDVGEAAGEFRECLQRVVAALQPPR